MHTYDYDGLSFGRKKFTRRFPYLKYSYTFYRFTQNSDFPTQNLFVYHEIRLMLHKKSYALNKIRAMHVWMNKDGQRSLRHPDMKSLNIEIVGLQSIQNNPVLLSKTT
jgi:hypothetical protein